MGAIAPNDILNVAPGALFGVERGLAGAHLRSGSLLWWGIVTSDGRTSNEDEKKSGGEEMKLHGVVAPLSIANALLLVGVAFVGIRCGGGNMHNTWRPCDEQPSFEMYDRRHISLLQRSHDASSVCCCCLGQSN